MKAWAVLALLALQPAVAAEAIVDRSEIGEILRQLFPRGEVSAAGRTAGPGAAAGDALANEPVYIVSGAPLNEAEHCAAAQRAGEGTALARRVRAKVFRFLDWTGRTEYLAVLQYAFEMEAAPPACPSIARIATLRRRRAGGWETTSEYVPELAEHHRLGSVRVLDLNADGFDELAVESDWGRAGLSESVMLIFDLSRGTLKQLAAIPTRVRRSGKKAERVRQSLDVASSQREHGLRFCFVRTVYEWHGRTFRPPRISHPCYPPGEGLNPPR